MILKIKDNRLWFPDGNIVLCGKPSADSKNPKDEYPVDNVVQVHFCVHKSVLARHSQVFRDMLDLSSSEAVTSGESYEGLPLVDLEDSASDLNALLSFLYEPCSLSMKRYDPDTPLRVEPILRMASKYQFDGVRNAIVERIKEDWPANYREWEQFEAHIDALSRPLDVGVPVLDLLIPEPASAICLARRYDIHQILPAAFLALSSMRIAHDYDKHRAMGDDGVNPPTTADVDYILPTDRTARWSLLDGRDMRILCRVREYLHVDLWTSFAQNSCSAQCEANHRSAVLSLQKMTVDFGDIYRVLESKVAKPNLCINCKSKFANELANIRTMIWPALVLLVNYSKLT
ncbi:hypothetical protein SCHPADRAFT_859299 [Schizopora paradoxa]|uniref:BTB domain-containing protein n=1 Tax=Schizopora paradoxa TaxID=27342 RepID=A0A0H2R9Y0_9AGAM|nr:hypothetical protein SCHPADRAFT_859299 [Schizopora paradoxa]